MPQMASLQSQTHQFASILPSFDHVLAIEAECAAHAEPQALEAGGGESAATERLSLQREFRLEDVWFAYQTSVSLHGPEFVLRGIDLTIEAGALTAVVGPSGAGKSTIADLVNGLLLLRADVFCWTAVSSLPPSFGSGAARWVTWVRRLCSSTRACATTCCGRSRTRPATRCAKRCCRPRQALSMSCPAALQTVVGDRGILLSSGERQRILLARALLRKPTLLILDEATNALDVENEARILDAIREVIRSSKQEGRSALTVLMIAHRPSAVRRADRIFELEDGCITRSGTWEEFNR